MIENPYKLLPFRNQTRYLFESKGPKGVIFKLVVFTQIEGNLWNLGFGDLKKGQLDSTIITNNQDVRRVLNTVAKAVYLFTENAPERVVRISPLDGKRAKLYNLIFQRRHFEIVEQFDVFGWVGNERSVYNPDNFYDTFEIHRKS
ncbi:MAG: DUF6934 family protein [Saprospiraceae bacterium]